MPELPEVETTRRGIEPHVMGHKVTNVIVRDRRLRWAIPPGFEQQLAGGTVAGTRRRAKYLLMDFDLQILKQWKLLKWFYLVRYRIN